MLFMQQEKLFICLVYFLFIYKNTKNKFIIDLYQKELLGHLSEDIKMWPSHNVLNW